jgi:F-type H+-transporting ATPase subunit epsilon
MAKLNIQLVTPERTVLSEEATSLICPTTEGQITILPGHTALISTIVSGELVTKNENKEQIIHVAGGFVQVQPGGQDIIILADAAEHVHEIDLARAEEAKLAAEQTLKEQSLSDEEYATAASLLQRNLSRIKIVRKHAHRKTSFNNEGVFHE